MARKAWRDSRPALIDAGQLQDLIAWLLGRGYAVYGPTVQQGVVRFGEVGGAADLASGTGDAQGPGSYKAVQRNDPLIFGQNNGPGSLKAFLFPADRLLLTAERSGRAVSVKMTPDERRPQAFIGCRACDLAALARLDRALLEGAYRDPDYAARRKALFIVAVNCSTVAPTCFCASMDAGPRPAALYDLCLTESLDKAGHRFVVEVGSEQGARALAALKHEPVTEELADLPTRTAEQAAASMTRRMPAAAAAVLAANREHPLWDEIGGRCLTCGNCTSVCPTCFCHTVEDTTDLAGATAQRRRKWDSCFTMGFSFVNGGSVRYSAASRYRHWVTHKMHTWRQQFGVDGCVGCGRCITWCPVGIDITEEVMRLEAAVVPPRE